MFRSIQWRITLSFILIVIIGMAALGAYLAVSVRNNETDNLRAQLENEATLAAAAGLGGINGSEPVTSLDSLAKTLGTKIGTRITYIDRTGKVLGDSDTDPATMDNHSSRREVAVALTGVTGEIIRYSTTLDRKMMYVAVPIIDDGRILGVARAALPFSHIDSYVKHVMVVTGITMAIITAFIIFAAWLIARIITRPIKQLTIASRKIASGKFDYRISLGTRDESARLARAFNDMAQRLQEMVDTISTDRARLSSVLDNMADGIIMTDNEGKVILTNRSARRLAGARTGETPRPLIETARDYELNEILQRCLETGLHQEIQFESSSTGRFLRAIAVKISREAGAATGVLILLQDLTELRGLQTMRRELVGNISHDFRTPLAGIKAMVETLHDGAVNEPNVAKDFLSRIEEEIDRLTQMVSELTELSRIETGRMEMKLEPVQVNRLIEEVFSELKPQAERQHVSFETDLFADLPEVSADIERLRRVITNLVHNAIKFNRPDGSIKAVTRATDVSVIVEITDTGIGIPRVDIPYIFDRFYKADRSRSGQGAGMGLAIVKHIIEAHGGEISVRSTEGKGSTFILSLPRK